MEYKLTAAERRLKNMATTQEKLADSLSVLKEYQDTHEDNLVICGASVLGETHTKRLMDNGYLQRVIKGWYIPSSPGNEGDSTVWYVSYWSFVVAYLNNKFAENWCLSPELSLYFYSGKSVIPKQLVIRSENASNNILELPFNTSILDIKANFPHNAIREPRYGIRLYPLPLALLMASPDYFRRNSLEARVCLSMLKDASEIIGPAMDGGNSTRAGRIAGALRVIGRPEMADIIVATMRQVGYSVQEENPFDDDINIKLLETSPYASRIKLMWSKMRDKVIEVKDSHNISPRPKSVAEILSMMDSSYIRDSYNSLSIEGYKVTEKLLEKVRSGVWNLRNDEEDRNRKDALAARGYYQAYQVLRQNISDTLHGKTNAAEMYTRNHQSWHFQLFDPAVQAGIIKASDLVGYRRHQVYIRNSMHTPLNPDALLDAMTMLSTCMQAENDAFVRAVLGHFFFVYIHPYMDGNGRTARFLMNSQLVTGGYKWAVVPVSHRDEYMKALEKASVAEEIEDFAEFITSLLV